MTQQARYETMLSYVEHPVDIRSGSGYPTVYQQASDIGGTFTRIKYGLPDQAEVIYLRRTRYHHQQLKRFYRSGRYR